MKVHVRFQSIYRRIHQQCPTFAECVPSVMEGDRVS